MVSWYLRCDPNQDAFRFTPSGDIYAYFERRPPPPIARFSSSPLNYQMTKAMGGPSRKLKAWTNLAIFHKPASTTVISQLLITFPAREMSH